MLTRDEAKTLRWIDEFRELPAEDIRAIGSKCRWQWHKPDQVVFARGDVATDVFFIVQGRVRITSYSVTGKQVSFRDLSVGKSFGELAAIDGRPRSATAVAITDTLLASMPATEYWHTMMSNPAVAAACMRRLAALVRALSERVIEYGLLPVPTRVKLELFRMAQAQGHGSNSAEIPRFPTHEEIASRVSTHREAVTRELRRLAKSGVVVRQGRRLLVPDMRALHASLGDLEKIESSR